MDQSTTQSSFREIRGFATGPLTDFDAVRARVTQSWSSDAAEGAIIRIKMIKRRMCGRAKLDPLRKRIIAGP